MFVETAIQMMCDGDSASSDSIPTWLDIMNPSTTYSANVNGLLRKSTEGMLTQMKSRVLDNVTASNEKRLEQIRQRLLKMRKKKQQQQRAFGR